MKRSCLFIFLVLATVLNLTPLLAGTYYFEKPELTTIPDNARILVYDANAHADKNATGALLKEQFADNAKFKTYTGLQRARLNAKLDATGTAARSTRLAGTPAICPPGQSPRGITALGNYSGCQTVGGDNASKEDKANKDTDATLAANSDARYASQKAVKGFVDGKTPLSLETYRGIGDGASHTLASLGITYVQAQAYWPLSFAEGLFDSGNFGDRENDWLALNEAVLACGEGYKVLLTKMYYVGGLGTTITKPITIEGVNNWTSGLVAAASPYFTVLTVAQYRGSGSSPHYAGGFEGGAHARVTNFHIKRVNKDWPNSQSSVGLQIGDGGDGYSYGGSVDRMVIENFGINLRLTDMGHGHIGQNNLYDFGVAGLMTAADGGNYGLGDNDIIGNYVMGDSQIHIRNYSTYEGTALETAFGGASHRPLSTKTAASYDIALKNQVAAYWHKFGGGNKFIGNKAHVTLTGYKVEFVDGIYLTGNASEFILFKAVDMPLNQSSGGYGLQSNITITGNELSFVRPFTDYSYFGITPTGITMDGTNADISNVTIGNNVFPTPGASQSADQDITAIHIAGDSASKFGAVTLGINTGYGLNVGVRVDAALDPAKCDILYSLVNNDDQVSPAAYGGYVDTIDTNGCLTDSLVSASGTNGEFQFAGTTGNLDSDPGFAWSAADSTFEHFREDGVGYTGIFGRYVDGTAGANHLFRKSRGSHASHTAVQSGDVLGSMRAEGHDGTASDETGFKVGGTLAFIANQTPWTSTAHGTKFELRTVRDSTTSNALTMSVDGSGNTTFAGGVTAASFSGPISSGTGVQLPNGSGGFTSDPAFSYSSGTQYLGKGAGTTHAPRLWVTDDGGFHVADILYDGSATFANLNTGVMDATSYKLSGAPLTFVTSITPGAGFTSATPITSTGTLNVDVGTGANQIPQYDGSARLTLNATTTALNVLATGAANVVPFRSERYRSAGTAVTAPLACMEVSLNSNAADVQDGGGPLVNFVFTDSGATSQLLGQVGAVRAGADNTGDIVFQTCTTGTCTEKTRITHDGKTVVNAGTNVVYYCNGGTNAGLLGRGNAGPCSGGSWVATSLKLD